MVVMSLMSPQRTSGDVAVSITSEVGAGRRSPALASRPLSTIDAPLGSLLRDWRQRRRLSQLDLALEAGVSARHLSFVETGRSKPSREMVLHLAEQLDVPLRDRNQLLLAAGFAPAYGEHALDAPEMAPVREALDRILNGHEPYPAVVVDRWWNLVAANARHRAVHRRRRAAPAASRRSTRCASRCTPTAWRRGSSTSPEWRAHLLDRLRRQVARHQRRPAGGAATRS